MSKPDVVETPKIRWALIGAGNIAQVAVLPAFAHAKETSTLVAIVSSDPEKKEALCARYGLEHAGNYDELEQILEQADVDAAYIALPNHLHRSFTERSEERRVGNGWWPGCRCRWSRSG
jgi:predicted dehydrogenase